MRPLSVLHVLAPSHAGGAESVVRSLAAGQRERGHRVRVAAVVSEESRDHPYVASLRDLGVDAVAVAVGDRAYVREGRFVRDLCRRHRPDVVHTHGFRPDVLDAAVARSLDVATMTTVHGFTGGGWRLRLYECVQQLAFRRFDAVAAVSRPLAERLEAGGVRRQRIHVVPNAIARGMPMPDRSTARRTLAVPDGRFVIGWVGRFSHEKGADVLLDAVSRLADEPSQSLRPVHVAMFGEGPERDSLGRRATSRGIDDRIRWHGLVPNAAAFFRAFDVFVLSSRTEGCPMVLLEAMAAGVPIVATSVGGVPDVLTAEQAVLVPPDDPGALARAVLDVHRDPASAGERARAAYDRLQAEFQPESWIDRYDALYRAISKRPTELQ